MNKTTQSFVISYLALALVLGTSHACDDPPEKLKPWLGPQNWVRDADAPVLPLGKKGDFDDTHIFAPTVARDKQQFLLWYCGSQGFAHDLAPTRTRDERVFRLGLAKSEDGIQFQRHDRSLFELPTPKRSIVTPTMLRDANGNLLREKGKIRMWFTAATLGGGGEPHSLHQATSKDGLEWTDLSDVQISRAYCPSVIKSDDGYRLWYTEPGRYPWNIRHATSLDGQSWQIHEKPVLTVSQPWEHDLQIYPCVLHIDGIYLMWYSSYLAKDHLQTAIGFAASLDGITWYKHPQNPILRPMPERDWESHYVSSHSVMRLDDGRFRIWYSSRKAPPFHNLYYAINTALWNGPD